MSITAKQLPITIFGQDLIGVYDGETLLAFTNKENQERLTRALTFLSRLEQVKEFFDFPEKEKIDPKEVPFNEYIMDSSWISRIGFADGYDVISGKFLKSGVGKGLLKVIKIENVKGIPTEQPPMFYRNVPWGVFNQLRQAESVGGEYNSLVRNKYERVDFV